MTDTTTLIWGLWLHEGHSLDQLAERFGYSKQWIAVIVEAKLDGRSSETPPTAHWENEP